MSVEELLHILGKPRLQFLHTLESKRLDAPLAVGTLGPAGAVHLVAAYVCIFIGEELEYLLPHVAAEFQREVLAQAERIVAVLTA